MKNIFRRAADAGNALSIRTLFVAAALAIGAAVALGNTGAAAGEMKQSVITPADQVEWFAMIPEMGDKGPKMSVVFGDLATKGQPIGVLVEVPAGTVSPPHIHSSDYWSVVFAGEESDFDGDASNAKPLPAGSWWYQPGKDPHANKCFGPDDCVFFVYYANGMDFTVVDPETYSPQD
jgi:hypothetical protein